MRGWPEPGTSSRERLDESSLLVIVHRVFRSAASAGRCRDPSMTRVSPAPLFRSTSRGPEVTTVNLDWSIALPKPHESEETARMHNLRRSLIPLALTAFPGHGRIQPGVSSRGRTRSSHSAIIVFGAHPDDCELDAGGAGARWAKLGHQVKFVAVTNGDIGHHEMAGAHPRAGDGPTKFANRPRFSASPRKSSTTTTASCSRRSKTAVRSRARSASGRLTSSSLIDRTTITPTTATRGSSFRTLRSW